MDFTLPVEAAAWTCPHLSPCACPAAAAPPEPLADVDVCQTHSAGDTDLAPPQQMASAPAGQYRNVKTVAMWGCRVAISQQVVQTHHCLNRWQMFLLAQHRYVKTVATWALRASSECAVNSWQYVE